MSKGAKNRGYSFKTQSRKSDTNQLQIDQINIDLDESEAIVGMTGVSEA